MTKFRIGLLLALCSATGLALVVALLLARFESPAGTGTDQLFPELAHERIRTALQPESSDEYMRTYRYAADGMTKENALVDFRDGSTGYINYRPDGTVSTFGSYYPAADSAVATPRLQAEYDTDGRSFLFERRYREDGSIIREGRRQADGSYLIRDYFEGGSRLSGEEVYARDAKLIRLTHWFDDGTVKKSVSADKSGAVTTEEFYPGGSRQYYHRVRNDSDEVWEYYREDGKTLVQRFKMVEVSAMRSVSYHVLAQYFKPDGSISQEREFHRSSMIVRFFDEDGKLAWVQRWKHINWQNARGDDLKLTPDQYVFEGLYLGKEIFDKDSYWFYDGGQKLRRHMFFDTSLPGRNMAYKDYDEETGVLKEYKRFFLKDGKVESEIVKPESGSTDEKFDYGSLPEGWDQPTLYVVPPRGPHESYGDD